MGGQDTLNFTSPILENDPAVESTRMPSLSHSAQSEMDLAPSPISQEMNSLLPDSNRGGQAQRWSLTVEKIRDALDSHAPVDPAQVIDKSRLEGESQSAKRRRIKREMAILQNLPVLLDQYPGN